MRLGAGDMTAASSSKSGVFAAAPTTSDAPGVLMRLRRDALQALAAGPLYRHTLLGRVPTDLKFRIGQRWRGDAKRGSAIASGEIDLAGELVRNPSPRWFPPSAGPGWLAAWHGFAWISDLAAAGGVTRDAARDLVQDWIAENASWNSIAWRSDILATRVFAWFGFFDG